MNAILEHAPADKRRRLMNDQYITLTNSISNFASLQLLLEKVIAHERIPTADIAFSILTRWFRIIAEDTDKLKLFQSWVKSSEEDTRAHHKLSPSLSGLADSVCKLEVRSPSSSSSNFEQFLPASPETPQSTHHSHSSLYKQLLQQQQQQANLLHIIQQQSQNNSVLNNIASVTLLQKSGPSGSLISIALKGSRWHPHTQLCSCTCGFTASEGGTVMSQRVPGGLEGQLRFMVPRMRQLSSVNSPSSPSNHPVVVHVVLCSSPDIPLICLDQFMYLTTPTSSPLNKSTNGINSDDDSDMSEAEASSSSPHDDDSNEGEVANKNNSTDNSQSASSSSASSIHPTPKQLMIIRERLLQFTSSPAFTSSSPRIVVQQQPPIRVVWKNRRLDTPFKIRIEMAEDIYNIATKYIAIAIVSDHKGRLQTDAADNYAEEFNPAGVATFSGLRMTKGTWGKEWSITFVAVAKLSLNSPSILASSTPCNIVVKTRKNPQIRHSGGILRDESPPSPVQFVERKPVASLKRNRVEDLLDGTPQPPHLNLNNLFPPMHQSPVLSISTPTSSSAPSISSISSILSSTNNKGLLSLPPTRSTSTDCTDRSSLHCDDMASLLYAAEMKQQEQAKLPTTQMSALAVAQQTSPPTTNNINTSNNNSPNNTTVDTHNFATLQSLVSFLEDIKAKHQLSLKVIAQPMIKEGVLVVKKGKPFRIPFRVQMRSCLGADAQQQGYTPQNYVCVAVVRNDKGEEVAVKNNEVTFDWCGVACFPGLMVMKGTWGKAVSLSFETRWASSTRLCSGVNGSGGGAWSPIRMLTMAETTPIPLMCYTKDKKSG